MQSQNDRDKPEVVELYRMSLERRMQTLNEVVRVLMVPADEQSDARERRCRADLKWTIFRRRPVIGDVIWQQGTAMNSEMESADARSRFTLGQLLITTTVLAVAMALISQYWRMANNTVDERTVPLYSASPASMLFLTSGLMVIGILAIVFFRTLIKRRQYLAGGLCLLSLSVCLSFGYPLLESKVISPVRGNKVAELHNDAAAIVATAIDSFYARTGKWPNSWNELDEDVGSVITQIKNGNAQSADPANFGIQDADEESQSIFSRSPDLGELDANDLRMLVQIDFDADPTVLAKMKWVDFPGIIPKKPTYNFYRVEFCKLIRRLNESRGSSEPPNVTAK